MPWPKEETTNSVQRFESTAGRIVSFNATMSSDLHMWLSKAYLHHSTLLQFYSSASLLCCNTTPGNPQLQARVPNPSTAQRVITQCLQRQSMYFTCVCAISREDVAYQPGLPEHEMGGVFHHRTRSLRGRRSGTIDNKRTAILTHFGNLCRTSC